VSKDDKKYLIVLGHFGQMGGAERQAFHIIRYLRQTRNADVAVLGWYGRQGPLAQTLTDWGCEIWSFPYKDIASRIKKVPNLLHLAAFIRQRIRPDFILPFVSVHSKPICQIWRLTGARYAWWNQQDEGRGLWGTNAERKALLNAVHITSNSVSGTEFLSRTYGIPEDRILTYNNGTVLPDIARLEPFWRAELGISKAVPLVMMAARVSPYKDHETLLQAWKTVLENVAAEEGETPLLVLAGHLEDSAQVTALKVLGFDLGLGKSVRFLGAVDKLNELMWESNLVVHSSVYEGCPNAVCEAMALAKPVVATDIPGTRQVLPQSLWRSCLSAPGDKDQLAQAITQMLNRRDLANAAGELNRQRIKEDFSIDGMCSFFMSLLDHSASQCRTTD